MVTSKDLCFGGGGKRRPASNIAERISFGIEATGAALLVRSFKSVCIVARRASRRASSLSTSRIAPAGAFRVSCMRRASDDKSPGSDVLAMLTTYRGHNLCEKIYRACSEE